MPFHPSRSLVSQLLVAVLVAAGLLGTGPNRAHAQEATGTINGQVQTVDGAPAPGVNVSLEGTALGSSTDEQGRYRISDVAPGTYTLVVSAVGLETQRREVQVDGGDTVTVSPITLDESIQELGEVIVEAGQQISYSTETSASAAKLPLEKIETPQVYNAITDELLADQVVTNFEEVMTNAPGVFKLWESTGRGSDGAGFYSLRGFSAQPTMMNGLPALTNGSPDPANIERVEILKGPSGTLYGSSLISYGGLINVVTKEPHSAFGGEISYKGGSFGLNRITADVNTPIGSDDELALRVNGAYHSQDTFQDAGFRRSAFLAPSLSYAPTDDLSFLVTTELYTSEKTNPTMLFLNRYSELSATNIEELGYNPEHSYTDNDLTIRNPTFNLQGEMRYELSDAWTAQTAISRSSASSEGYYSYLWEGAGGNGMYTRFINSQNSTTLNTDLQQNLIGDVTLLGTEHQMVVGVDYRHQRIVNNSTGYVGVDQISLGASNPLGLSQVAVDTALAAASTTHSVTEQAAYSTYASDVVHVVPQLSLMASLRVDHFDQKGTLASSEDDYTQTALSPKFGIVVQPVPNRLSLFGNYMNGFSNVEPRTQDDGTTKSFAPEHADQWEVGIKADAFNDRLTASLSYYDITVSNVVREDPNRANFYVQNGEQYSRGVEASVKAAPVEGLTLTAGYSHNESEVTRGSAEYEGRRPEEAGPQDLVNAWASYRITGGLLEGIGIGLGGNYASENLILNRTTTGQFTLPAYTVFDASLSYEATDYRLDLKVNNLTDETYYKGWTTVNPQAPRSVTANVTYKF
jgi:iron complex outermembrane receptor protein